jgi:hypothetical protein
MHNARGDVMMTRNPGAETRHRDGENVVVIECALRSASDIPTKETNLTPTSI